MFQILMSHLRPFTPPPHPPPRTILRVVFFEPHLSPCRCPLKIQCLVLFCSWMSRDPVPPPPFYSLSFVSEQYSILYTFLRAVYTRRNNHFTIDPSSFSRGGAAAWCSASSGRRQPHSSSRSADRPPCPRRRPKSASLCPQRGCAASPTLVPWELERNCPSRPLYCIFVFFFNLSSLK